MRDPGTPRRNPLFDHTFDETDDGAVPFVGAPEDRAEPRLRALDDASAWSDDFDWGDDPFADTASDRDADGGTDDPFGRAQAPTDPLAGLTGIVAALTEAQPEAVEHLVTAAHEVVLAVKTVVDATEAALAQQRADLAARREARDQG
ncbi:MAG: hypothetical protein RL531_1504 [Actinomycetota bacterium]|jgi:hypothetical protein